jgi:hypothetical protein
MKRPACLKDVQANQLCKGAEGNSKQETQENDEIVHLSWA